MRGYSMVVIRTAEHYAGQLQALLPPGPAWDPERVPELQQVIAGLSREFARIDGRAFDLLNEMDPATVSELVPDWERVMNLPDPCLGLKPLFADRRLSVRQRLVATGGQNAAFYIDIAVSQGYPNATVTEHRTP
ncbi:Tail protein, partial [Pseudomonas savastanoi pv. savastanoi]